MTNETPAVPIRRNLVVCCDGTSNGLTAERTNVLRLWFALERSPTQLAYYDPGVGTLGDPGASSRIGRKLSRWIDLATGKGVRENVIEAYEFLMENYAGDKDAIYLFGFSRGAYTVRALAGMIDMFGILPRGSRNLVPYVWQIYSNDEKDTSRIGRRFALAASLAQLSRRPRVHFLGVWDTVSSWGWFFDFGSLPRTKAYRRVDHVRHAVALDERRAAFRQNLFDDVAGTDLRQVWFPGVHCDVGGGYRADESGLARRAFEWMLDEAIEKGLRVDTKARAEAFGATEPRLLAHESLRGAWWLLEWVPRRGWKRDETTNTWRRSWKLNRGRRRRVSPDAERYAARETPSATPMP